MLAEEEPALFDAFQNNHGPRIEATIRNRPYVLSFVNTSGREYCLAGLFAITGHCFRTNEDLDDDPRNRALQERYDDCSFAEVGRRTGLAGRLVFDLSPAPEMSDLAGRLIVERPVGRAYARLAENLDCPVLEISRDRRLVPPAPEWDGFIVTTAEVRRMPSAHAARLREWRGVYLIVDEADGQRQVGSASGAENLLGRWQAHVARDRGVTAELGKRDPTGFRFSILELLAPSASAEEVLAIEGNWKDRLATRSWGLNRN